MPFNCPGHESRLKGLSGCVIDTVSAPLDTVFAVEFVVSDAYTPSARAAVSRLVVVVSPCQPEDIYCAELADPQQAPGSGHACGTTDCVSRAAIVALQPAEPVAPILTFSSAVPLTSVSESEGTSTTSPIQGHEHRSFSQVQTVPLHPHPFVVLCDELSCCLF